VTLPRPRAERLRSGAAPVALSWSGGKDSALALLAISRDPALRIVRLVTTTIIPTERLASHDVRRAIVDAQATALGLPVSYVPLPLKASNEEYERAMQRELLQLRRAGVRRIAYGDLFLEDVRAYRQQLLAPLGMTALYPLWGRGTAQLAEEFVDDGFRAVVVCVDAARLDAGFCGREFDREFLRDLPRTVDPCGENGEFHTFVYDGPIFEHALEVTRGGVAERGGFVYCDLT
jgi:uncharacterized protein (TIGR00290 family)